MEISKSADNIERIEAKIIIMLTNTSGLDHSTAEWTVIPPLFYPKLCCMIIH